MQIIPISELTFDPCLNSVDFFYSFTSDLTKHIDYFYSILSNEEIERAKKFHFEIDRQTYIVSHGSLRFILAKKLNIKPLDIVYTKNSFEKPIIEKPNCFFNLSHTSNFFGIVYSNKFSIGVDIEKFERDINWQAISERFYSDEENEQINHSEKAEQVRTFTATWTRKEAILKAIGCGMVNDLKEINSVNEHFQLTNELVKSIGFEPEFLRLNLKTFICENHVASIAFPENFKINSQKIEL